MTAPAPQTRPDRVAWLRGINVGGNKRVSMAQLRAVAVDLGWRQVSTHLNSGNLLFGAQGPASEVAAQLSEAIGERLGVEVAVLVREAADLGALLAANPFPEGDPSRVCVAFVDSAVSTQQWQRLEDLSAPPERLAYLPPDLVIDFANGLGQSGLAARLPVALRPAVVTVRNLRTVQAVAAKLGAAPSPEGPTSESVGQAVPRRG
ncbi:MAG: DUF1697 domain-containing protein [Propionicimonas sp.]